LSVPHRKHVASLLRAQQVSSKDLLEGVQFAKVGSGSCGIKERNFVAEVRAQFGSLEERERLLLEIVTGAVVKSQMTENTKRVL
jgi:hypothetical protein